MLTKQDLDSIRGVVRDEARVVIKEELRPIKKELQDIKDRNEDLEIKLDEKVSELSMEIFRLRAEFKEEIRNIKRSLNKMYKHQETIIKFFNEEAILIKKRIDRIETKINLPSS